MSADGFSGTDGDDRRHDGELRQPADGSASGGEWQELVDLLMASLNSSQAKVTSGERDELRSLLEAMDMPTGQLNTLNVESES